MRYASIEERFFARLITKTRYECNNRRSIDFDIDAETLVSMWKQQNGLCALTKAPMSLIRGGKTTKSNPEVCTIDRINPNLGYMKDNIQLVRWRVNRIKSVLMQEEFIEICNAVVNTHVITKGEKHDTIVDQ